MLAFFRAVLGAADPIQASDWLVSGDPSIPKLTEGTLGGVPSLTLSNGLASRVFVLAPDSIQLSRDERVSTRLKVDGLPHD